jgi:hypothetical protein
MDFLSMCSFLKIISYKIIDLILFLPKWFAHRRKNLMGGGGGERKEISPFDTTVKGTI